MAKRTAGGRKQRRLMCLSMHFPPPASQSRCSSFHFKREKPGVGWRRNFTRHTKQTPASTFIAKVINFLYISGYPLSVKGEKSALLLFRMLFLFLALTKVDGWFREQAEGGKAMRQHNIPYFLWWNREYFSRFEDRAGRFDHSLMRDL